MREVKQGTTLKGRTAIGHLSFGLDLAFGLRLAFGLWVLFAIWTLGFVWHLDFGFCLAFGLWHLSLSEGLPGRGASPC